MRAELDPLLHAEYPELSLPYRVLQTTRARTPPELVQRLGALASRVTGATTLSFRTRAETIAVRGFYRQVGLDPDRDPPPAEAVLRDRLLHGGFRTGWLIPDALTLAIAETGVSLWAVDLAAAGLTLPLRLGLNGGQVVLGERTPLAVSTVDETTRDLAIYTLALPGVSELAIEEAFWICGEALDTGSSPQ